MRRGLIPALVLCAAPLAAQDAPDPAMAGDGHPVELEVVHDWRAGPATRALAAAFEAATQHVWIDGQEEEMVLVSRIIGGDPPEAALMPLGRRAEELARAGFLLDLTDLAAAQEWRRKMSDPALLDACTIDGRVYCVPVTLRLEGWLMLSRPAFARAGLAMPESWEALVADADPLRAAGAAPLVIGTAGNLGEVLNAFTLAGGGRADWEAAHANGDSAAVGTPAFTQAFEEFALARDLSRGGNAGAAPAEDDAIGGPAASVSADGSWAGAAGGDLKCLPGLGKAGPLVVTGDGFVFPDRRDPEIRKAQLTLASFLLDPAVQTDLSNHLGVLPARGNLDLPALHPCTRRGLMALATNGSVPARDSVLPPGLGEAIDALLTEFWNDPAMTAADLQSRYAETVARGR